MKKALFLIIFLLSAICLIISLKLFWNMGIFADMYNTSPEVVNGGGFWLLMDWVRLFFLFILCVVSGIGIFKSGQNK